MMNLPMYFLCPVIPVAEEAMMGLRASVHYIKHRDIIGCLRNFQLHLASKLVIPLPLLDDSSYFPWSFETIFTTWDEMHIVLLMNFAHVA